MKPEDITPQNALQLVRNKNWRRAFRAAQKREFIEFPKAKYPVWSNRWWDIASKCEATPDELRQIAFHLLKTRNPYEFLDALIFHPSMPDDMLEHLLNIEKKTQSNSFTVTIAHRANTNQKIVERIAEEFEVEDAIATLALQFYASDDYGDEFFTAFLKRHQDNQALKEIFEYEAWQLPKPKQQIVSELFPGIQLREI